jgi:carboxypeptidase C (cathepsin A)
MYAPMLAWGIHQSNQEVSMGVSDKPHINLKGFIASNGATDWNTDPYISTIEVANSFNILPNEMYEIYVEKGCRLYW